MGANVYEKIPGFKVVAGPVTIKEFPAASTIYERGLVKLVFGLVSPWTAGSAPAGVAITSAAPGGKALISIDPETIYEATAYSKYLETYRGLCCQVIEENALNSERIGSYSAQKIAMPGSATPNSGTPVQVVGPAGNTTSNPSTNYKVLVKLVDGAFEPEVDAT